MAKKNTWIKPELISLSRESSDEVSLLSCKLNAVVKGYKGGKKKCKVAGCNKTTVTS